MAANEVVTLVVNVLFVLASLAALRLWLRHRSPATGWLLGSFAVFDLVILATLLDESTIEGGLVGRLLIIVLLLAPYLLFRFADAIVPARVWARRTADLLMVGVVAMTAMLPTLPGDEGPQTVFATVWFATALGYWTLTNVAAGWLLVRASMGEPGVVRNRLRVLAAAVIGLGLVIPASSLVTGGDEASVALEVVTDLLTAGLAALFLVGFAPPTLLRAAWRHDDEQRLYAAAVALMGAEGADAVATVLVPGVRQLIGAPGVTLATADGEVIAEAGDTSRAPRRVREIRTRAIGELHLEMVVTSTMPIFGVDEDRHLDRLVLLAELALDRARLLQAERAARDEVERLNDELESFVYTTSHDLKNPVIALTGYLDVLREDHADALAGEVLHIVDRMHVNARHMDALIRDLLELSRVGRVDTEPEHIHLEALVDDIARDVASGHPGLSVDRGSLPDLWMNATRARQLFTNLFDNAAAYGGRTDITITVTGEPIEHGTRLWVRDDGQGIPEAYLDRVFGVFERLEPEGPGGTGMGLAICRRLVEGFGGDIRAVPSEQGAAIRIDLPQSVVRGDIRPSTLEGTTA